MTALGFLYPGYSAEDDYPRLEQLLGSDIRLPLVHTDIGEDAHRVDALLEMGSAARLAAGVEELGARRGGRGVGVHQRQLRLRLGGRARAGARARAAAGMPASRTSFAFAHAVRELGAAGRDRRDVPGGRRRALRRLPEGGRRRGGVAARRGIITAAEVGTWGEEEVLALARGGDHPDAEAVLLPDTALHTAGYLPALEAELGKPVLTANQVTVWEGLRLPDRRVNAPALGALFTREPIVQV